MDINTFKEQLKKQKIIQDSSKVNNSMVDTTNNYSTNVTTTAYKVSKDQLDDKVTYEAEDSIIYDIPNKIVYLYGKAKIKYQKITINADEATFNWDKSEVAAKGTLDSNGIQKRVEFIDDDKEYLAYEARYNFKTKKGKSIGLVTKESAGFLHGEVVKIINDSTFYAKNARYTTCDYDHPHFYIEVQKAKVIKDKLIVGKPANLVIGDVRTPLILPFAFLPDIKSKGSGLIVPEFGDGGDLGFYFRGIGYYWHINDKMDLTTTADFYTLGSWAVNTSYNFKKLYKYGGNINLSLAQIRPSSFEKRNPNNEKLPLDFAIRTNFNIDQKKLYNSSFNVNLNISTNRYRELNTTNQQTLLSTTLNSNISYSKSFPGKPFRLSLNSGLNQNTQSKKISLSLPDFGFNVTQINPFKRKIQATKEKWYERITFSYNLAAKNQIDAPDSTFFSKQTLKDMRNGIYQSIPISANIKIFKFLNFSNNFNYNERWYFNQTQKQFFDTLIALNNNTNTLDTFTNKVITTNINKFSTQRDFSFNTGFNTILYGTFNFKKSKLKGIRHTVRPSLNFNFQPDFSNPKWKYYKTVQSDALGNTAQYSKYENQIFGGPPSGKQASMNFGINNTLEIKVYSKKDSINHSKKITIFDNLNINSGYNFAAKEFKLSQITINGSTNIVNKIALNFGVNLDAYALDSLGRKINTFQYKTNKKIVRFSTFNMSVGGSVQSKTKQDGKGVNTNVTNENKNVYQDRNVYNFDIPWSFRYDYNLNINKTKSNKKDTIVAQQTISASFDFNITSKWKVTTSTGFDLTRKKLTSTQINVTRDLHCWQLDFSWQPQQNSYRIALYVKSQQFRFLRLQKQNQFFDSGILSGGFSDINGLVP